MTINASTLNYVRQKADDGKRWADLHEQLKAVAAMNLPGEQKKLAAIKADQAKAEAALKSAQERTASSHAAADGIVAEARRLKKEAEDMIAGAASRAAQIAAEARLGAQRVVEEWDRVIAGKRDEHDHITAERDAMADNLRGLQKQHEALQKKHDELIAKHQQLQNALQAMRSSL